MTRIGTYEQVRDQLKKLQSLTGYDHELAPEHVVATIYDEPVFKAMKKDAKTWLCWYNEDWFIQR